MTRRPSSTVQYRPDYRPASRDVGSHARSTSTMICENHRPVPSGISQGITHTRTHTHARTRHATTCNANRPDGAGRWRSVAPAVKRPDPYDLPRPRFTGGTHQQVVSRANPGSSKVAGFLADTTRYVLRTERVSRPSGRSPARRARRPGRRSRTGAEPGRGPA